MGAIGVVIGCCIGMSCLLFMDLEKVKRQEKQEALKPLFDTLMDHGHRLLNVQHCTFWLVEDDASGTKVHTRAHSGVGTNEAALRIAFNNWDADIDGSLQVEELKRGLDEIDRKKTSAEVSAL